MGRAPCCDKATVKKGPWAPEEDARLKGYIDENGTGGNWIALPQKIGLKRCGKSCRLRWLNYLRPNIKHGDFTEEEEHIICSLYISIGSRWSIIAAQLPGRTDNDIKNYWNTKLKKKLLGKRAPSRRARASQEMAPYQLAGGGGCSSSSNGAAAAAAAHALSSSALERIQLHMRLQGLYSAFGSASVHALPPPPQQQQWPKLEPSSTLSMVQPTDAVATTVSVSAVQQPQDLVGHGLDAAAVVEAEQLISSSAGAGAGAGAAANYMSVGGLERSKLGFCSPAVTEGEVGSAMEMCSASMHMVDGLVYSHDELYDFLYSKHLAAGSVGGVLQGGGAPPLPELELECPDGGAIVGADEKFSTWTASCDVYGQTGDHQLQLHGSSISLQDYVLGYDQ